MKDFINWFFDNLFGEKVGNAICRTAITLALLYVAFEAMRGLGVISVPV